MLSHRLGGGLHGTQVAAASCVLLLLDDGGGHEEAATDLSLSMHSASVSACMALPQAREVRQQTREVSWK